MNPVVFWCPKTGREIDVGIDINWRSLQDVQPVMLRLVCPFCARPHEWRLADGWIKDPRARA